MPGKRSANLTKRHVVWFGQITTPARLRRWGLLLALLPVGWLLVLLVLPSVLLIAVSLAQRDPDGRIIWQLTWDNYRRLAGFGLLGYSADSLRILWRSVWVAGLTTALALGLAYPLAFWIALARPWVRGVLLMAVVAPLCTNLVVRTYAWELLLSPQLPPARLALALGWLEAEQALYPSLIAVLLGMVANALPFAVLPLATAAWKLDWALVDAARDLSAGRLRLFQHAIWPQTRAAAVVAVIFTFVPAMGMFVISDRLGGARFMLVGNLIQQQLSVSRDYPYGAAVSLLMVVLTLVGLALYRKAAALESTARLSEV